MGNILIVLSSLFLVICADQNVGLASAIDEPFPPVSQGTLHIVYDHFKRMHTLAVEGRAKEAIAMDREIQVVPGYKAGLGDFETMYFHKMHGLGLSYARLAKEAQLYPDLARQHIQTALDNFNTYITNFGNVTSQIPDVQQRFMIHRFSIYNDKACLTQELFALIYVPNSSQNLVPFIKQTIKSYKLAVITYTEFHSSFIKPQVMQETFKEIRFSLITQYCNLAAKSPAERVMCFKEACLIRDGFRGNDQFSFLKAKKMIEAHQQYFVSSTGKNDTTASRVGPKVRAMRKIKAQKQISQAIDLLSEFQNEQGEEIKPLKVKIEEDFCEINKLDLSDKETFLRNIHQKLLAIEDRISGHVTGAGDDRLRQIYQRFIQFLGDNDPLLQVYCYAFSFQDIAGALSRLEILKDLQIQKNGCPSMSIRVLLAKVKVLNGEPEEWIALEQELEAKKRKVADKRKKRQAAKRQAKIQVIQEKQAEALEAEKELAALSQTPKPPVKPVQKIADTPEFFETEPKESEAERKQAKLDRHKAAEERKAEKAKEEENEAIASTSAPQPAIEIAEEPVLLPLRDLYHLTSTALDVDREIEAETWQITRDQLKIYFEALGCVYKDHQGGSHGKLQLPKSIHVERDGQVITIFIEEGGALTLPTWEKGYIKDYLKPQIQAARLKLQKLGMAARNVMQP